MWALCPKAHTHHPIKSSYNLLRHAFSPPFYGKQNGEFSNSGRPHCFASPLFPPVEDGQLSHLHKNQTGSFLCIKMSLHSLFWAVLVWTWWAVLPLIWLRSNSLLVLYNLRHLCEKRNLHRKERRIGWWADGSQAPATRKNSPGLEWGDGTKRSWWNPGDGYNDIHCKVLSALICLNVCVIIF